MPCFSGKISSLNEEKKTNENFEKIPNSFDKRNLKNISTNNLLTNISKINKGSFPPITIDMNVLNKNNQKYLKFYDAIKNKL